MIKAQLSPAGNFTSRVTERARRVALAHAASRLLARRNDPRRWRIANLLWPNFRKDS